MANVAFYHLTRNKSDEALPPLLAKTMAAEKKAVVCCLKNNFKQVSTAIWSRQPESWLPHGIAGQHDADAGVCPIWVTDNPEDAANGGEFLFFLDGQAPEKLPDAERIFILFDGTDEDAVSAARGQWKTFGGDGHQLSYWQQDGAGKWTQAR